MNNMKDKHQAPSTKLQRNTKHQNSNRGTAQKLKLGAWSFSGAWSLELGAFSRRAFTLIELLVVIAVIAILAALIIPITAAVNRAKVLSRSRGELANIETAIEDYKATRGFYPPDTPGLPATNQLYYELLGTKQTGKFPTIYTTLDGSATILESQIPNIFTGVGGFMNSTRVDANDETQTATRFLRNGLKPSQIGQLMAGKITAPVSIIVGVPWPDPNTSLFPRSAGNQYPTNTYNPFRYNSSSPTNNANSFDLWIDVLIAGKTNRISNWSGKPIIVYSPGS